MNHGTIDPTTSYHLVLNEDFKAPVFDGVNAGTDPDWYTNTPWPYGNNSWRPPFGVASPFSLGPNGLTITATVDTNGNWSSGLLCSVNDSLGTKGFSTHSGYIEAVMQFQNVPGIWPGFWLNTVGAAATDTAPAIELDVIEYYGHDSSTFQSTMHVWGATGQLREQFCTPQVTRGSLCSGFHAYGVEIKTDVLRFYLDRQCYWQIPTPKELTRPLGIIVGLAMGAGWPLPEHITSVSMGVKSIQAYT